MLRILRVDCNSVWCWCTSVKGNVRDTQYTDQDLNNLSKFPFLHWEIAISLFKNWHAKIKYKTGVVCLNRARKYEKDMTKGFKQLGVEYAWRMSLDLYFVSKEQRVCAFKDHRKLWKYILLKELPKCRAHTTHKIDGDSGTRASKKTTEH